MEEPRYGRTQQTSREHISEAVPQPRQADRTETAPATRAEPRPSGWLGWVMFAGIGMIILGAFQALMGLVGLFHQGFYLVTANNLAVPVNFTAWGWFHLIVGVVVLLAGIAVMSGKTWGRVVGITLAAIQAFVNFAWLPAYPFWSFIIIAFDVLVIYALAVYGKEMKAFNRAGMT
ncbi:hypothetical protein Nocox_39955 [Nonomuraea coxensis DSM 45129]|uniref:DUF7144 domain-containing protein n=1 Tax=Nonomuraea coxensis DSM 45129 TaxID=1122611 RepID=A0ABX8UG01_9ACTN|nr:hypothetical protein [Nonomuraea coxensis]QYC45534.1 hypothetical protein Nocox_39955 [Nonomuraea coxensis DSM 45129]